ncbi:carbohydrate ABC transporter permease [Fictibacillus enclensis]|uniref:carbohydrate ABC transporter permease n=1 Tax=Fictibacillus enclensis TaxID=1017270 RepID=UPI0025A306DE|nr:carbohydrate ABC transporter permease [Fictibacillus enclensis]MDM5196669.1 carbohydrate ABC transporter permease [Fictibacillus enclensis]
MINTEIAKSNVPVVHKKAAVIKKGTASRILITLLMLFIAFSMIFPFVWMVSTSLKKPIEVFAYPIQWIPSTFEWHNYKDVWFGTHPFWLYYWNSFKVTALTVIGTVLFSSAAAYGFSRLQFKGRDAIFFLFLATMMVPEQVTLIPRFILFNYLGIYDSHLALILPGMFTAFGTFLLRQFYMGIPKDYSEAALLEGANHFQIWTKIIIPLSKPALVSLIILSFTLNWNEFVNPLVFLTSDNLFTVPLGLANFIDESGTNYTAMMAAAVSAILPVMLLFITCQKWFIEGVSASGIKG